MDNNYSILLLQLKKNALGPIILCVHIFLKNLFYLIKIEKHQNANAIFLIITTNKGQMKVIFLQNFVLHLRKYAHTIGGPVFFTGCPQKYTILLLNLPFCIEFYVLFKNLPESSEKKVIRNQHEN